MTDMIAVWDRHGEQFVRPRDAVMLWVEMGRLFLECPANPMPHWKAGMPGILYTIVSDDGNSMAEYFSVDGLVPAAARTQPT